MSAWRGIWSQFPAQGKQQRGKKNVQLGHELHIFFFIFFLLLQDESRNWFVQKKWPATCWNYWQVWWPVNENVVMCAMLWKLTCSFISFQPQILVKHRCDCWRTTGCWMELRHSVFSKNCIREKLDWVHWWGVRAANPISSRVSAGRAYKFHDNIT